MVFRQEVDRRKREKKRIYRNETNISDSDHFHHFTSNLHSSTQAEWWLIDFFFFLSFHFQLKKGFPIKMKFLFFFLGVIYLVFPAMSIDSLPNSAAKYLSFQNDSSESNKSLVKFKSENTFQTEKDVKRKYKQITKYHGFFVSLWRSINGLKENWNLFAMIRKKWKLLSTTTTVTHTKW